MSYQLPIYMYKMRLVYVTDRSSSDGYEILGLWISVVDGKSSNSNTFPMKCIIFDVLSIQRRNTGLVLFTSFADNQFQDLENEMCKATSFCLFFIIDIFLWNLVFRFLRS